MSDALYLRWRRRCASANLDRASAAPYALSRLITQLAHASVVQLQNGIRDSPSELTDPPCFGRWEETAIRLTLFRRSLLTDLAQFLIRLPSLKGDRKRPEISKWFAGVDLRRSISRESLRREFCTGRPRHCPSIAFHH